MSLLTLLLVILVIAAVFGGVGHQRWGYAGWSPLGIVLVVLVVLWLSGGLGHGHGWRVR